MSDRDADGDESDGGGRGLLGRLRAWIGSLFGGGTGSDIADADADAGGETGAAAAGVCAVCGTSVRDPGDGCPLCGSTAIEPNDGGDQSGSESADHGTPAPERRAVEGTTDDAVTRLRDVRGRDETGTNGGTHDPPVDDVGGDGPGEVPNGDDGERRSGTGG